MFQKIQNKIIEFGNKRYFYIIISIYIIIIIL